MSPTASFAPGAPGAAGPVAVGERAPDFTTRDQHGETVTLASTLAAGPVLLVFYPWAFSSICTSELAGLRDVHAALGEQVRVLACSCDAMFTLRAFAEAEQLDYTLITDHWPHGAIARAYGVFDDDAGCALRGSFLVDADGTVSWRVVNGIGEARDILAHLEQVRATAR